MSYFQFHQVDLHLDILHLRGKNDHLKPTFVMARTTIMDSGYLYYSVNMNITSIVDIDLGFKKPVELGMVCVKASLGVLGNLYFKCKAAACSHISWSLQLHTRLGKLNVLVSSLFIDFDEAETGIYNA
jgi:hypothetical protein